MLISLSIPIVKKAFKTCGMRKHKSPCTLPKGAISKLFRSFWEDWVLRTVMCSVLTFYKAVGQFRHDHAVSSLSLRLWKKICFTTVSKKVR